jgi:hypothetical protein
VSTQKHYFIEETKDNRFAIHAKGSKRASEILPTQKAAFERAAALNPDDRPDVERVRKVAGGGPDKWRSK